MKLQNKPFYIETKIEVKSYDIDVVGHVNNIVYIRWLEDIRMNFLNKYLSYESLITEGISPVLTKTEIEYILPIKLFDDVVAKAFISDVKGPRLIIESEFYVKDNLMAKAKQTGIFFDINKQKPARPPGELMNQWNIFLDDRDI